LDESDDEWDEHVLEEYGPWWRNTLWREEEALDAGLDMADLVHHAFHYYDENVVFNDRDFMNRFQNRATKRPYWTHNGADRDVGSHEGRFYE
jgi:hypothetical protein